MKKVILTGALIASALLSQAQFSLGIKGGLNLANIRVSGSTTTTPKTNPLFNAGIVTNYALNDKFSIQLEGLYTLKGFKSKSDLIEQNVVLNYVEFPLLGKFSFGDPEALQFFVTAGPYVAFKTGGNMKLTMNGNTFSSDISSQINSVDFGANAGGGVAYNLGTGALFVDARYGYGLSNILSKSTSNLKQYNANIQFSLGYLYSFGK